MAAMSRYFPHVCSALHMEAEACRAGLIIAIHQGWSNVELECDCASLVAVLSSDKEDYSEVGRIIEDCRRYIMAFNSIQIRHIYREANSVAHRLAHFASFSFLDDLWLEETPAIIRDVLYEDLCNCARGFGHTSPSRCTQIIANNT